MTVTIPRAANAPPGPFNVGEPPFKRPPGRNIRPANRIYNEII